MLGAGALGRPRGMVWGGRREEGSEWEKIIANEATDKEFISKINKLWYIYTMEYYSGIKKNTF